MADNVNKFEIFASEQQFVEVVQVYVAALFTLKCFNKCRYDCSLLLNSEKEGFY